MNKRQALAELRKLGYQKSAMQLMRGASSYTLGGKSPYSVGGLMITLSEHGFIVTGSKRWSFMSAALNIGNLQAGARSRYGEIMERLVELGVVSPDGGEVPDVLSFAVAIATGERVEAAGEFNGV